MKRELSVIPPGWGGAETREAVEGHRGADGAFNHRPGGQGTPVTETCRMVCISQAAVFNWKM